MLSHSLLKMELLQVMKSMQANTPTSPEFEIINAVCTALKVDFASLITRSRNTELVMTRCIMFYLLNKQAKLSYKAIGRLFNRDHSTVMNGLNTFDDLVHTRNQAFLPMLNKVEAELPGIDFFNSDKYG